MVEKVKDITLHTDGVAHVVSFVGFNPSQYSTTHQQYLAKNPRGYCPDHSCGVSFDSAELPVGEKA